MMRFLFLKAWRGMEELEGAPEEVCKALLHEARESAPWRAAGFRFALFAVFVLAFWVDVSYVVPFADSFTPRGPGEEERGLVLIVVAFAILLLAPIGVVLATRDHWNRRMLRRHLRDVRCVCGYSLLGLSIERTPEREILRCPECGHGTEVTTTMRYRLNAAIVTPLPPSSP